MLITVSGIVGSGKTTIAKQIVSFLEESNETTQVLRFQSLPCFSWLTLPGRRARSATSHTGQSSNNPIRWVGYKRRRLTAAAASVYVARIAAFRLYRLSWPSGQWQVSNRYFYDLLVHYELSSKTERLWHALLQRLIPQPDLAILVTASPATITARRPNYSREYIENVLSGYERLQDDCPTLVVISTDSGQSPAECIRSLLPALSNAADANMKTLR